MSNIISRCAPTQMANKGLSMKNKERIQVKCKEYYWGYCRITRDECEREKCKKFKTDPPLKNK